MSSEKQTQMKCCQLHSCQAPSHCRILASFVRCSPVSRGNEEFCDCHLPFYSTFAWSGFVGISIILIILANGISMWKNTILALASWIKEMLLRTSGSQKGSLVA